MYLFFINELMYLFFINVLIYLVFINVLIYLVFISVWIYLVFINVWIYLFFINVLRYLVYLEYEGNLENMSLIALWYRFYTPKNNKKRFLRFLLCLIKHGFLTNQSARIGSYLYYNGLQLSLWLFFLSFSCFIFYIEYGTLVHPHKTVTCKIF